MSTDLREKTATLRKLLAEADRLSAGGAPAGGPGIAEIRARDRVRKRATLLEAKALWIPKPKDLARREDLESDVFRWLPWYLPDVFVDPFQEHHSEMVQGILAAIVHGGDQAFAAPRGEGKTTLTEGVAIYCILRGLIQFVVIFAATGADATNSLSSMKSYISGSERLAEDYPEVALPIREVEDTPNRAHSLVVYGEEYPYTSARFQWSGEEVTMPPVPGSRCGGAIIATRGLDAAVRGLKKGTRGPQLAIIDDPDTENSARTEEQADKLARRIERAIAGLAPKGKRLARVMLTTLQNRICASYRFASPRLKPSWKGTRFAFVKRPPDHADLWDEYVSTRHADLQRLDAEGKQEDPYARRAHRYYLQRRAIMDVGAELANPFSFDNRTLPDGTQLQVSALQRYYDFVADNGLEAALSELQNDPPEEDAAQTAELSAYRIQRQVSGFPRKVIPPLCTWLTQGIDVRKVALHWVVRAWQVDAARQLVTGYTIDYGVTEVLGTHPGNDEGLDEALMRALNARKEAVEMDPYATADGERKPIAVTLVDAGWRTEAVYRFCRDAGLKYKPAMGFGKSAGCASANFAAPVRQTTDKKLGDRWFLSRRPLGVWLVCMDADHWKSWEHDRWRSDPTRPGALVVFGESSGLADRMSQDEKWHMSYGKHITAEQESEEIINGRLVRKFKSKSDNNHYLDASYMADVGASMCGIRLFRKSPASHPQPAKRRRPAEETSRGGMMPGGQSFLVTDR